MGAVRAQSRKVSVMDGAMAGLGLGTFVGAVYFVVEPLLVFGDALPFFGLPVVSVLMVYVVFGAVIGLVAGTLTGLSARSLPVPVSAATFSALGFFFSGLFILRSATREQLLHLSTQRILALAIGLVVWIVLTALMARLLPRRSVKRGRVWFAIGGFALFACTALVLWGPLVHERLPSRKARLANAPNVVMVLVDAMRADHLSAYGYERPTSPTIDRLAGEGALFRNAYSHGNRTIIATPSLFTSLYPSYHGAVGFQDVMVPLNDSRLTIGELFNEAGYNTLGMMSNIYLKTPFGLTQGFDRVEEFNGVRFRLSVFRLLVALGLMDIPPYAFGASPSATDVTDAGIEWLQRTSNDRPFFFYLHYMDAHHAYTPPDEFESMFRSSPETGVMDADELFMKTVHLVKGPPPIEFSDLELTRLTDLYDACIRYTDHEIGRFLDAVASRDSERETIVILTSDHGDEFMEHGSLYHTNLLHEELIRVPLVVWRSQHDSGGRRIDDMVRHIDVLPTLAEWIGSDVPSEAMGVSLAPLLDGGTGPKASETFAEGDFCLALVKDGWKIMHVDTSDVAYLYDLTADPEGRIDVAAEHPEVLADMKRRLDDYLAEVNLLREGTEQRAGSETLRQLRALGYIN